MFCPKCGNQMNDDATFCSVCGERQTASTQQAAPVQQYTAPAQPIAPVQPQQGEAVAKKKGGKTVLVIILIVLIVAALAAGAIFLLPKLLNKNSDTQTYDHLAFVDGVAIYNGQVVEDGDDIRGDIRFASLSGNCYVTNYGCVIKDGKAYQIKDYGDPNGLCFSVAASGDGVAYLAKGSGINQLDTNTGNITKIEKDGGFYGVVISPDGKTVLYSNGEQAFLYCDGKSERMMKGEMNRLAVVAVANGGEYIHLLDMINWTYYCLNKDGDKLYKRENISATIATNYNNTQVLLMDREDDNLKIIYDAVEDKDTEITSSDSLMSSVHPVGAQSFSYDYYRDFASTHGHIAKVAYFNVESLSDCYYTHYQGNGIGKIEGDEMKSIFDDDTKYTIKVLSDDSIVAFGIDRENGGELVMIRDDEEEKIDSGVMGFGVSLDEKTIYYFTKDEKLMMYRKGKSTEIDDDVCVENYFDGLSAIGVTIPMIVGNDIILYGKNDGEVYMYKDGKTENADDMDFDPVDVMAGYLAWAPRLETNLASMSRNSALFLTTPYLPYMDGNDYFVMDAKGNITELDP
ncbi:MAG: zinc ribbon domain-containing protein [Ruminococcaceae bacterium]|nr:zinc ribbon domain-containing protein [Oscillospiraceae bacterium]